jgi:hypothetical protein
MQLAKLWLNARTLIGSKSIGRKSWSAALSGRCKMRRWELLLVANLLILVLPLLTACSGDCDWSATVRTWVDENENGVWDADEPPLPDVRVIVESYHIPGIAEAVSSDAGEARLYTLTGGCPKEAVFFVYALPPWNYRPSIGSLKPAPETDERVFEFGFISLNFPP